MTFPMMERSFLFLKTLREKQEFVYKKFIFPAAVVVVEVAETCYNTDIV